MIEHLLKIFVTSFIELLHVNLNSNVYIFFKLLGFYFVFKSVVCFSGLVWGSSVKHQPQKVGIEHVLNDEDVVQIVKKV